METSEPSVSSLETHLGYWLRQVSNAASGQFARSLEARQTSVAEWVVLRRLYDNSLATPGYLAEAVHLTRGAVSKVLDKLEAKGWVRSTIDPKDNRFQFLSLTAAGRRAMPLLAEAADRNDEHFFACLDSAERHSLRQLLQKLAIQHRLSAVPAE